MTRYLLDTNAVLGWLRGSLPVSVSSCIDDPADQVWVSATAPWEIGIKRAKGHLRTPDDFLEVVRTAGFETLSITAEHADRAAALPPHHRDPFDRMLVAQAQIDRMTIVTSDRTIPLYDVTVLAF